MRTPSTKHRIYLLYRQSQTEESMISFIRDKLIRKGCSVIQDVTQSTMVLVLLTPGVFEFIDAPHDKVRNELVYVLRRYDEYRVLGILCDLFKWPDSVHLPDEILSLKSCDAIEWSPENRDAFMKCLLERIDPALLDIMSCPTSPRIIHEDEEAVWNGGEGRNGVSTQAQNEEEVDGSLRRTGSAFYFDELNEHVERKSEVPVGRKRQPKITEYPALGSPSDQGRLEETSDDTDIDESYDMDAYRPPELPESVQSSAVPVSESQAYRPPELPRDEADPNAESDYSEHAIASRGAPIFNGDEPDSYGISELRRKQVDTYEPPELPLDEDVQTSIEEQRHETPSPSGATATIRPRSADKKSIYVPPPSPPSLESSQNNGRDETDAAKTSSRSSRGKAPLSGTTTVVVEQRDPEETPGTSQNGIQEDQASNRSNGETRPEPERSRPHSRTPTARSLSERGVDTTIVPHNPYRNPGFTQSSSRGSPNPRIDASRSERKSPLAKFFHRKTFKLPSDSEVHYGRFADEHPYWNAGTYRKFDLMDEFCDESYFANKRNTLPRTSVRIPRRNSSRPQYSEPERSTDIRPERAASVVVLDQTEIHSYVPEVDATSGESSDHAEARKRDAGSTPVSERKTYRPVEEYRPPAEPEVVEAPIAVVLADDRNGSAPTPEKYDPPAEPQISREPDVDAEEPSRHEVEEYGPPEEPQEVIVSEEAPETSATGAYSTPEEPGRTTGTPEVNPPPYEAGVQVVPDYVVLPPPRQHLLINYPKIEESVPLQEIEPLPDQQTYIQQLSAPRRHPCLAKPSELRKTIPDVRIAAHWAQVEVDSQTASPVNGRNGGLEYKPPPLPTTEMESENGRHRINDSASPIPRTSKEEIVRLTPAVIRSYRPPELPVESALKSEPIAYVEVERGPEPLIREDIVAEPRAHYVPRVDMESKSKPIAHRETKPRAPASYKPPPVPEDATIPPARSGQSKLIHKTEPLVVTRRLEPILGSVAASNDIQDGASFSKQNIKTDSSAHTQMDAPSGSTVVEATRLGRPIIVVRRPLHPGDEMSTPFTPPNSFTESEPTIHENIRRAQPLIYHQEPPITETVPVRSSTIGRKPAIPEEFSRSLLSSAEESYQPPPVPTAPLPESFLAAEEETPRFLIDRRKTDPIAHRMLPENVQAPSSTTVTTTYYPSPVPFNDEIEDKDKAQTSIPRRKTEPVCYKQSSRSRQQPAPAYVPPQLPAGGDVHEEFKGSSVASIKPPPAYKQYNSNDGDDEEEGDTENRIARNEHRKPVKIDPEAQLREESHAPKERRSRSVIEVSNSTMEPVLRRRVNSLDPRLTRDLREYVERHVCNKSCCKVVCPRRLAENIDNLHYADDVRILTNLDVLGRRRLSYLLAVEAQRYVSYLDSKFISAAGGDEGSKTPDSGCDPSSKVSGGDSDATISDGEFVSEEAVARELAKIEKIRQRNAQFQENGVIPPPHGFSSIDRHQVYQSSERDQKKAKRTRDSYQPPPLPSSETDSVRSSRSMQAQDTYWRPELPTENQNAYRAPSRPSGDESQYGIPSNPAAREAMKNIIEGRIVFEPNSRKTAPSDEQRESDAKEAYNTWRMIWKNEKREEIPALSGHEILSLFGVMRHILGTKSSLQEVRNDLRTIIRKNGMGLKR